MKEGDFVNIIVAGESTGQCGTIIDTVYRHVPHADYNVWYVVRFRNLSVCEFRPFELEKIEREGNVLGEREIIKSGKDGYK